ncbi:type IV secretory system conjugative DNA transfer family protein [Mitsuokella sp.]|uniref:type IV secretory system conjugative DNA transfer family protein n=1 Tax=Mitsuokella sp. TaxID=2049034 RepID=UPI003D7E28B4
MMEEKYAFDEFQLGTSARCRVSMDTHKTQCNNNILVVGGSGSGKTRSILNPMMLHLKYGNAVGVFTKTGMTHDIARMLRCRYGYKTYEIDFSTPEISIYGYDPLCHCSKDTDIEALVQSIINPDQRDSHADPFWEQSAAGLLRPVLRYVMRHAAKKNKMQEALRLLDSVPFTHLDEWGQSWEAATSLYTCTLKDGKKVWAGEEKGEVEHGGLEAPDTIRRLKKCYLLYELERLERRDPQGGNAWRSLSQGAEQTSRSILQCLQIPLQQMFTETVRRLVCHKNQFDFEKLLEPKTVLFVYTSPVNPAMNALVSLFYSQLFTFLFERAERRLSRTLPYPVYVLCDDFATGCKVPNFAQHISVFREMGISATMLIQSESQLSALYGEKDATTIVNNSDTYVYLGGMDYTTSQKVAARMNKPVDDILHMPIGTEYFFRRGQKPIKTKRYNLLEDPDYKLMMQMKQGKTPKSETKTLGKQEKIRKSE